MKRLIISILILINSSAFSQNDELTIKVTSTFQAPLVFKQGDTLQGVEIDNIRNMAKNLGFNVSFEIQEWKKALTETAEGKFDMIFLAEETAERDKVYYFSKPTVLQKTLYYKRKDFDFKVKSTKSFANLRVGIGDGFKYEAKVQKLIDDHLIHTFTVYGDNIDLEGLLKVAFKQTDLYICAQIVCDYQIDTYKNTFKELNILDYADANTGEVSALHYAFPKSSKNSARLLNLFNNQISQYIGSAQHIAVLKKYGVSLEDRN